MMRPGRCRSSVKRLFHLNSREVKSMKAVRKWNGVSRRKFGALLTASSTLAPAVLAQEDAQHQAKPGEGKNAAPPAPGNFRRPLVPETPPFEGKLEFARQRVALAAEPFPMSQVQ